MTSSLGAGNTLGTFPLGRGGRIEGGGRLYVSLQITVGRLFLLRRNRPETEGKVSVRARTSPTRDTRQKAVTNIDPFESAHNSNTNPKLAEIED
ncbi:hypothetical protein NPIL_201491 [Nephila pilipes]|uniref:Uncharacterized protein n=1 Tax=Nephila pilipes TaxID=299642 RepID=A0A8X6NAG0_NEPPI|nr:hypothetical protein NPIL_201491 [Nephila pilipes]